MTPSQSYRIENFCKVNTLEVITKTLFWKKSYVFATKLRAFPLKHALIEDQNLELSYTLTTKFPSLGNNIYPHPS